MEARVLSYYIILWIGLLSIDNKMLAQESQFRNASDIPNMAPLASLTELRASKEIYYLWAQDDIFKDQIVDYVPTPEPTTSLLAGDITDVIIPSQVGSGKYTNETTRTAAHAADIDDDGIDEVIKLTSIPSGDVLLSITEVKSNFNATGNTITTQIEGPISSLIQAKLWLGSGNFDSDQAVEIIVVVPLGSPSSMDRLLVGVFDIDGGRLEEIAQFHIQGTLVKYDAVATDFNLDGQAEIVICTQETHDDEEVVSMRVLACEDKELIEKNSHDIATLGDATLDTALSLSLSEGDYNGDVAREVALFIRQIDGDQKGHTIAMIILQSVDDLSTSNEDLFEKLLVLSEQIVHETPLEFAVPYAPIYAESGDLNGDGNDQLVLYSPLDRLLFVPQIQNLDSTFLESYPLMSDFSDPIFCFTRGGQQTISITINDLNRDGVEELVHGFVEGCTEDIYSDNILGARITTEVFDLSGGEPKLTAVHHSVGFTSFQGVLPAAFILGEFNGDNLRAGKGRFSKISRLSQPIIILNAPPIHFDVLEGQPFDINRCYDGSMCDFASTYFRSSTSTMETSTTISSAWSVSATVEGSASVGDPLIAKAEISASVTGRYGENFSKYEASSQTLEISTQVSAIEDDQIYATVNDYDIWEYPIYEKDSLIAHLISVTPTLQENRWFPSKSFNAHDYLPDHEVGNILSYREMRADYSTVRTSIASDAFTLSSNSLNKWTINQRSFTESGSSFEQEIGLEASVTVEAEAQFKIFGGSVSATVEGTYDRSDLVTHRTAVSEELEITVDLGGVDESLGEVKYSVNPYCYWSKDGALVVDYITRPEVPAPGASDTWWSANYGKQPDPALILPWRYDPEKGLTLQDEEVKRFQSKSVAFSNDSPEPGDTITIFVEVHNWSLQPTLQPVEVGLYTCDPTDEANRLVGTNGGKVISTPAILEPRGSEILSFKWQVPEGLPTFPRIYARLDPNNREEEIHEENNYGFNLLNLSTNRAPCPAPMITSTEEIVPWQNLVAFPNPVEESLQISMDLIQAKQITCRLVNSLGHICHQSSELIGWSGTTNYSIDMSDLPDGLYYYQILVDGKMGTGSVVKL